GSHPHQAGAGDRGPSAGRACDPGASEGTARLMHDRRADVARSLGELARRSEAWLLPQFEVSLAFESGKIDADDAGYVDIIEREVSDHLDFGRAILVVDGAKVGAAAVERHDKLGASPRVGELDGNMTQRNGLLHGLARFLAQRRHYRMGTFAEKFH